MRASIVSCRVGSECSRRLELADDAAHRIDAHARAVEAAVQVLVVLRLDPGDADRLTGAARARSAFVPSIAELYFAEKAEKRAAQVYLADSSERKVS